MLEFIPTVLVHDYSDKEFEGKLHGFYQSREWKDIREQVKKELTPMCPVCGSEHNLVVDHIQPIRYFWDRRTDINNLQILCSDCNLEKGSMLNWTIEWHIRNKKSLENRRKSIDLEIHRKQQRNDNKKAYKGLEEWEQSELSSCYASYLSRCQGKNIEVISKYDLRVHIEEKMRGTGDSPWRYKTTIIKYIKENINNIKRIC